MSFMLFCVLMILCYLLRIITTCVKLHIPLRRINTQYLDLDYKFFAKIVFLAPTTYTKIVNFQLTYYTSDYNGSMACRKITHIEIVQF